MKRRGLLLATGLVALATMLSVPAFRAGAAYAADIDEMIATMKTPADHEAIAAYFDKQAADAKAKAAEHQKMGEAYKKGGGSYANKTHFHEHCEALVRMYTQEAKEYTAMAASHRNMAKHAK